MRSHYWLKSWLAVCFYFRRLVPDTAFSLMQWCLPKYLGFKHTLVAQELGLAGV